MHEAYDTANFRFEDLPDQQANHIERCLALSLLKREKRRTDELLSAANTGYTDGEVVIDSGA